MRTPLAPRATMALALAVLPLLAGCSTYRGVERPIQGPWFSVPITVSTWPSMATAYACEISGFKGWAGD